MNIDCPLLEEQIDRLRELINNELQTTPYVVDCLIAKLLNDLINDYINNYAQQLIYWREIIKLIKEQIVEGNSNEIS